MDEELFMACVRAAARGDDRQPLRRWPGQRLGGAAGPFAGPLCRDLPAICTARGGRAHGAGAEGPRLRHGSHIRSGGAARLTIRLRNLRLARAIAAADAGEVLEDVERPRTRFDDVIGADAAKEELKFFIDYLKNPRRFAALGLKPPKGVLLLRPARHGQDHAGPGDGRANRTWPSSRSRPAAS